VIALERCTGIHVPFSNGGICPRDIDAWLSCGERGKQGSVPTGKHVFRTTYGGVGWLLRVLQAVKNSKKWQQTPLPETLFTPKQLVT